MDILNNREIATAFWCLVFIIWASTKSEIRAAFKRMVLVFLSKYILIFVSLMGLYTVALVFALDSLGLWENHQIKNVLFWFCSAGMYSLFQATKAAETPHFFTSAVKDNLKITVLLQFIITVYTFSLLVELIVVPLMTSLVAMLAFSEGKKEYQVVSKHLNKLMEVIGIFIILYTVYRLVTDFGEFGKVKTAYDLMVPVTLSICLLPFIYIVAAFSSYQIVYLRLNFLIKDKTLRRHAKLSAIKNLHLRFAKLHRWADSLSLENMVSKSDVDASFDNLFKQLKDEHNPPLVDAEDGWSPFKADKFLEAHGLKTAQYKNIYDDVWHMSSPYLDIGDEILPNNIAYYVEGTRDVANTLTLKLNVNEPNRAEESQRLFEDIASELFEKATSATLPEAIKNAINKTESSVTSMDGISIMCQINEWGDKTKFDRTFKLHIELTQD